VENVNILLLLLKNNSCQLVLDNVAFSCYNGTIEIDKGTEMTEFEKKCYGMSTEDIKNQFFDSITFKLSGPTMVVAGLMSDAQEVMAMGDVESARKFLNIAKFILFETTENVEA